MALTPQTVETIRGDSKTFTLSLANASDGSAFNPTGWFLIHTVKARTENGAGDGGAIVQKSSNTGITISGASSISVEYVAADTASLLVNVPQIFDVQAQNAITGEVRTVAIGVIKNSPDVTERTTVSIPIYTSNPSSTAYPWGLVTGRPTTLAGYGITDAQPLDADLTAIAALSTTAFGRSVLTQANAAALATLAGVGTANSPTFSALTLSATTAATSTTSGALIVSGGVGVAGALYTGQQIEAAGYVSIRNDTGILIRETGGSASYGQLTKTAAGALTITNSLAAGNIALVAGTTGSVLVANAVATTSTTTGALVVSGGVGIAGALYVGGIITANGTGAHTFAGPLAIAVTGSNFLGNGSVLNLQYASDGGTNLLTWKNSSGTALWSIGGGVDTRQDELAFRRGSTTVLYLDSSNNTRTAGTLTINGTGTSTVAGSLVVSGGSAASGSALVVKDVNSVAVGGGFALQTSGGVDKWRFGLRPQSGALTDDLKFVAHNGVAWVDILALTNAGAATLSGAFTANGQIRSQNTGAATSFVGTGGNSNIQIFHPASGAVRFFNSGAGGLMLGMDGSGVGSSVGTGADLNVGTTLTINTGAANPPTVILGGSPTGNFGTYISMIGSNAQTNWRVATNATIAGALEFTPSTAAGGATFSTPLLSLTSGQASIGGALSVTGLAGFGGATLTSTPVVIRASSASSQMLGFVDTNASGKTWLIGPGIGTGAATNFGIYNLTDTKLALSLTNAGLASFAGQVSVAGGAASSDVALRVSPSSGMTGSLQYGIHAFPTFSSAATIATGAIFGIGTAAAAFALSTGFGIRAFSPTLGAGSSITTLYGISIENQGATGVTDAIGLSISAQTGASGVNVGLRNAGTTQLTNATASTSTTTGSLVVSGGVGIAGALYVGGVLDVRPTIAAGTYASLVFGASGAARDIFCAGQLGVSNGFTVQYDGTNMVYTLAAGTTITAASTTGRAGFRILTGAAPTSPTDGDIWQDGTNLKIRIGGATKTVTLT